MARVSKKTEKPRRTTAPKGVAKPRTPSPTRVPTRGTKKERELRELINIAPQNVRRSGRAKRANVRIGAPVSANAPKEFIETTTSGRREDDEDWRHVPWKALDVDIKISVMDAGVGMTKLWAANEAAWEYAADITAAYGMMDIIDAGGEEDEDEEMGEAFAPDVDNEASKLDILAHVVGTLS